MTPCVLLTGAGGMLGRRVAGRLSAAGTRVVSLGVTPRPGARDHHVLPDPADVGALRRLIEAVRPQWILHLAGTTQGDASTLYAVNTLWGLALLEAAFQAGTSTAVLLVGSAAEYGPQGAVAESGFGHSIDEASPCAPQSLYGISKFAQTLHGLAASRQQPVVIARPFNLLAPDMSPTLALGRFIQQIRAMPPEGGTLHTGPLHAVRDFVSADDAAALLIALTRCDAALGRIVNLCSGVGTPMAALVQTLMAAAPVPVRLDAAPSPAQSAPDIAIGSCRMLRQLGLPVPACPVDTVVAAAVAGGNGPVQAR